MSSIQHNFLEYLCLNHNVLTKSNDIIDFLDKYDSSKNIEEKKLISSIFELLFGLSIEAINSLQIIICKKDRLSKEENEKKELYKLIQIHTTIIRDLENDITELRDNYWKLNQLIIKQKK
tara:strand:+ start:245 stop:604 length:360 start_codon:yes stop_codon:yes gene_type:complete